MDFVSDSSSDGLGFNYIRFIKFLQDNNVLSVAIAAVLSDRINELTNTFVNSLIMPIINRDGDGDGEEDIKKFENMKYKILGMKFEIGLLAISIIKFIIITYVIFILSKALKMILKKYNDTF